jgi:DNA-binding HxlR family transcriptional regulator
MSGQRPMPATLDLLGRRWSLRLVWELRRDTVGFSELRARTRISPSVLTTRLGELGDAGVVERDPGRRYRLTGHGRELARLLYEINRWAESAGSAGVSSQRERA